MANWFHSMLGGGRRRRSNRQEEPEANFGTDFDFGSLESSLEASLGSLFSRQAPLRPQQHQHESKAAPPASRKAIRQLPTVTVTPEDLVEESNRECCICLEENNLKDRVTRLPCAHIYHPHCILDWLGKHCTCPVCRYELPTDDPAYELGRMERMKHRKPRFAQYELERMTVSELQRFSEQKHVSTCGTLTKQDLICKIIESGKIDLVVAPKPVEYPLSLLRAMGVGELKRTMADAGVFFDRIDVVEKEDMVRIFINSGRLQIVEEVKVELPIEEETVESTTLPPKEQVKSSLLKESKKKRFKKRKQAQVLVETVTESDDEEQDFRNRKMSSRTSSPRSYFMDFDETFVEPDNEPSRHATTASQPNSSEHESTVEPAVDNSNHRSFRESVESIADEQGEEAELSNEATLERNESDDDESQTPFAADSSNEATGTSQCEGEMEDEDVVMEDDFETDAPIADNEDQPEAVGATVPSAQYQEQSIVELREIARRLGIDISDCIERSEMVYLLVNAPASPRQFYPTVETDDFDSWSVSSLRGTGRALGVDMSQCTDRSDMVEQLVLAAGANQRVANYLDALTPLGRLSVSELRAVARDWHVNVSDCLEKGEMIDRLVVAGGPRNDF